MTFPDPYGSGQDAVQPPPPRFTAAPPVPAGYGYGQYEAVPVPPGMYVDR